MKLHKRSINISKKVQLIFCGQILLMALFFVNNYDLLGGIADTALMNRPGFLSPSIRNLNDISDFHQGEGFITPDQLTEAQLIYGLASADRIIGSATATGHKEEIEVLGLGNVFVEDSNIVEEFFNTAEATNVDEGECKVFFSEFKNNPFLNEFAALFSVLTSNMSDNRSVNSPPRTPKQIDEFTRRNEMPNTPPFDFINLFYYDLFYSSYGADTIDFNNQVISDFQEKINPFLATNYNTSVYNVPELYNDLYTIFYENQNISPQDAVITQKFCNVVVGNLLVGTENNEQQYNLKSGVLIVNADAYIGYQADATFGHTGGTNETKSLILGVESGVTGTYNLDSGAALYAETQVIGTDGIGEFNHNGGINIAKLMLMGFAENSEGTYTLNVSHTKEEYDLLTQSDLHDLNVDQIIVGKSGNATFNHVQGTSKVSYSLFIGDDFFSDGKYIFNEGILDTNILGIGNKGVGTFEFKGEDTELNSNVTVIGYGGTYIQKDDLEGIVDNPEAVYQALITHGYIEEDGLILEKFYAFEDTVIAVDLGFKLMYDGEGNVIAIHTDDHNKIYKLKQIRSEPLHKSTGTFIQKNGVNNSKYLVLTNRLGSEGTYTLEGGTLNTNNTFLGYLGKSLFHQTGGTHEIKENLYIAVYNAVPEEGEYISVATAQNPGYGKNYTSKYVLDGGTLKVHGNIEGVAGISNFIIDGGTLELDGEMSSVHNFFVGYEKSGSHIQAENSEYSVIDFNLGFLENSTGTYTLSENATLRADRQANIGYRGTGNFTIKGGTLIAPELFVGNTHCSAGNLTIESGSVSIANDMFVGYNGSSGNVDHKGGTVGASTLHVGRTAYSETIIRDHYEDYFQDGSPIVYNASNGVDNSGSLNFGTAELYFAGFINAVVVNNMGLLQAPNNPTAGLANMTVSVWFKKSELWGTNGDDLANIKTVSTAWWEYGVASGWILSTHEPEAWDLNSEKMNVGIYGDNNSFPMEEEWINHTLVFGDDVIKEYINGDLVNERLSNQGLIGLGNKLQIGGWVDHSWVNAETPVIGYLVDGGLVWDCSYFFPYEGDLDEVLLYDKALTDDEISKLFQRNGSGTSDGVEYLKAESLDDGIIVYYPFDEAPEDGKVYDKSYLLYNDNKVSIYTLNGNDAEVTTETTHVGIFGKFDHKSGTHETDTLRVESSGLFRGEYNFEKGFLSASLINIEGKLSIISLDAEIVVSRYICFYSDSYLEAVLGAEITLNSAGFNVLSTSPENLQFENLNLIFNESVNVLEVACAELIENYFDQNFAFNSIELNGALTLIDLVDNQLDGEGNEVLYVRNLIFNENGEIDLGSTTLYYEKLFLGDTEVELEDVDGRYSNGQLQQIYPPAPTAMPVPEPSVFVLSLFGFCILRKFTARINYDNEAA